MVAGLPVDARFAASAEEALSCVAEHPPDLLLTDYRMSGMNGLALIEAVLAKHPRTTCALHTGESESLGGLPPGVKVFAKPTAPEILVDLIQQAGARSNEA